MKRILLFVLASRALSASFAYELAEPIAQPGENWIYSPFSISACLSMAAAGANGKTEDDFKSILGLSDEIDFGFEKMLDAFEHAPAEPADFEMRIAQGAWIKDDFAILPSYAQLLSSFFHASAERVPFGPETARRINSWVSKMTRGKIEDLLTEDDLNEKSRLVLANALYFHGSWQHPFPAHHTHKRAFHLSNGSAIECDTMSETSRALYFENETFQAAALSFHTDRKSPFRPACLLILPKNEPCFSEEAVKTALSSLNWRKVRFSVPKFILEEKIELTPILKTLGLERAFSKNADFSKIDGIGELCLSKVLHKTFFAFDEEGVEAAAATAAVINATTSIQPEREIAIPFIADRPFYVLLVDLNSQTPFFIGRVENPLMN